MKMKKTLTSIAAVLLIISCLSSNAAISGGQLDLNAVFERFQSYECFDNGVWSAHDLQTARLISTLSDYGKIQSFISTGACIIYPQARGDTDLGLYEVILNVCLFGNAPIKVDGLSIRVPGMRYDFVVSSQKEKVGAFTMEMFTLPLDRSGINMVHAMINTGFDVAVYGEMGSYRTSVNVYTDNPTPKQEFEVQSISALRSMMDILDEAGIMFYDLWDLNAARWANDRPNTACVQLDDKDLPEILPQVDQEFGFLIIDDKKSVELMQQMLLENAFYSGKADGKYGNETRAAIREAQRYYGLLQTGQADRILITTLDGRVETLNDDSMLTKETIDASAYIDAQLGVSYRINEVVQVRLDRYWFARRLLPQNAMAAQNTGTSKTVSHHAQSQSTASSIITPNRAAADVVPKNSSNVLFILDGEITCLGKESIFLPLDINAELTVDSEYKYPCTVRCEQNRSTSFGMQLLPLETTRLVLYAEIPIEACYDRSFTLHINIKRLEKTGAELAFKLQ